MVNSVLIITGPTGIGKTKLGLVLAKKFGGEIVSADSRQIYKGMDIITGKDLPANSKFKVPSSKLQEKIWSLLKQKLRVGTYQFNNIPVWGLDLTEPDQKFDVTKFVVTAREIIKHIWARNKLPIVVGGTGFYIRSLLISQETYGIKVNEKLRAKLGKLSTAKLQKRLKQMNAAKWKQMNNSDKNNPRRLIRAIEIAKSRIKNQELRIKNKAKPHAVNLSTKANILWLGLRADLKLINKKIKDRVIKRLRDGAEDEVKSLVEKNNSWELPCMTALGHKEWRDYFDGKITKQETISQWILHEQQYAKRQLTWFRKEQDINWLDMEGKSYIEKVVRIVREWQELE